MAYYTHDGVRHETREEALEHLNSNHITEVPPFTDKLYVDLHKKDWGEYSLQAVPTEGVDSLYLELYQTTFHEGEFGGYNLIRMAANNDKTISEVHSRGQKAMVFMSMLKQEIYNTLEELADSPAHFYDDERPEVVLTYDIQNLGEDDEEFVIISYTIDHVIEDSIEVPSKSVDALELVLNSVKEQFVIETEGKYDPESGKVGGNDFYKMLDHAVRIDKELSIKIKMDEHKEDEE